VVVPAGLKDAFNASRPDQDAKNPTIVKRVTNPEVPQLIEKIYGIPAPATPRNDLGEIFLTGITTKAGGPIKADLNSQLNNKDVDPKRFVPSEQLRLNLGVPVTAEPNRLGVLAGDLQGFPNGRRLTDDVLDIEIQALEGAVSVSGRGGAPTGVDIVEPLATGDLVDTNDRAFGSVFPYLALPYSASEVVGTPGPSPTATPTDDAGAAPTSSGTDVEVGGSVAGPVTGLVGGLVLALGGLGLLRRHRASGTAVPANG
jgi:Domain of unknown function (DUF4331)